MVLLEGVEKEIYNALLCILKGTIEKICTGGNGRTDSSNVLRCCYCLRFMKSPSLINRSHLAVVLNKCTERLQKILIEKSPRLYQLW